MLELVYLLSGIVFGLAYIPQIITLWHDRTGAVAMSISSRAIYAACNLIGLIYAVIINGDIYFVLFSFIATLGCLAILLLAVMRRLELHYLPTKCVRV